MVKMIFPTKHLPIKRALISISAEVYELIGDKSTTSSIWEEYSKMLSKSLRTADVSYDWFILSIDLLYLLKMIEFRDGFIKRKCNVK